MVVIDNADLAELAQVWQGAGHIATSAATIVIVVPIQDDARLAALISYDVGQATMQMALAATELGIGLGHASIGDQDPSATPPTDRSHSFASSTDERSTTSSTATAGIRLRALARYAPDCAQKTRINGALPMLLPGDQHHSTRSPLNDY